MSNNEVSVGKLDPLIWLVVVAIVFGGVYANMQFVAESVLIRAVGGLVLAAVAIGIALQAVKGRAAWDLAREARVEVRKVIWPTRQETTQTTMIVVVVVIVVGLLLWALDSGLSWGVRAVIG